AGGKSGCAAGFCCAGIRALGTSDSHHLVWAWHLCEPAKPWPQRLDPFPFLRDCYIRSGPAVGRNCMDFRAALGELDVRGQRSEVRRQRTEVRGKLKAETLKADIRRQRPGGYQLSTTRHAD